MVDLSLRERAAMLVLMSQSRAMTNTELAEFGASLDAAQRARLNDAQLVLSTRSGRTFRHELTDGGWRWCVLELGARRPARSGPAGGALYSVLAGLKRYLERHDLAAADVFRPDPEGEVRRAYAGAATRPGEWVGLADLRERIEGISREDVDATLARMFGSAGVNLAPEVNDKALTDRDRRAAVRIGAKDVHMLAIAAS